MYQIKIPPKNIHLFTEVSFPVWVNGKHYIWALWGNGLGIKCKISVFLFVLCCILLYYWWWARLGAWGVVSGGLVALTWSLAYSSDGCFRMDVLLVESFLQYLPLYQQLFEGGSCGCRITWSVNCSDNGPLTWAFTCCSFIFRLSKFPHVMCILPASSNFVSLCGHFFKFWLRSQIPEQKGIFISDVTPGGKELGNMWLLLLVKQKDKWCFCWYLISALNTFKLCYLTVVPSSLPFLFFLCLQIGGSV